VAWLPQANVSYNPFDFAAGRVVLFEFDLRRPVINHRAAPETGGSTSRSCCGFGGPDKGPHGPATLIPLFRKRFGSTGRDGDAAACRRGRPEAW